MSLVVVYWRLYETANRCFVHRARAQALSGRAQGLVNACEDRVEAVPREALAVLLRETQDFLAGFVKSRFRWESVFSRQDYERFLSLESRFAELERQLGVEGEAEEDMDDLARTDLLSGKQLVVAALSSMTSEDREAVDRGLEGLCSFFAGRTIASLAGDIRGSLSQTRLPPKGRLSIPETAAGSDREEDRETLRVLAEALEMRHASWRSARPLSEWYGVFADDRGRVTGLSLWASGLAGCLPEQLGSLSHLTSLWLPGNKIRGAIPWEIGQLRLLTALDLSDNAISGEV